MCIRIYVYMYVYVLDFNSFKPFVTLFGYRHCLLKEIFNGTYSGIK